MPGFTEYEQNIGPALSQVASAPPQGAFSPVPQQQQRNLPPGVQGIAGPQPQGMSAAQPQQGMGQGNTSFFDVWRAGTEDERKKIADDFEKQGVDIDTDVREAAINDPEAAAKYGLTGNKKVDDLSREEKAGLLMEFGLRLMQASANNTTGGAFAEAGLGTLGTYRGMKDEKKAEAKEADALTRERADKERQFGIDERKATASETQASAATTQAEAAMKRAGAGVKQIVENNGQAWAVMEDGTKKPLGMAWHSSMGSSSAANRPSATRDKYNLFMESYARQNPDATPEDMATMEKAALAWAQQSGQDQSIGARSKALETVTGIIEADIRGTNLTAEEKIAKIKKMRDEVASWIITGEQGNAFDDFD